MLSLLQYNDNDDIDIFTQSKPSLCGIIVSLKDAIDKQHTLYPSEKRLYELIYSALNVDEFEKEKQKIIKITQLSTDPVVIPKILQLDHDDIISNSNAFQEQTGCIIGEDEKEFELNNPSANKDDNNDDDDDFNNDNGTEFDKDVI